MARAKRRKVQGRRMEEDRRTRLAAREGEWQKGEGAECMEIRSHAIQL